MAWPDRRICNGCKKVFNSDECEIDIGDFWNCREEMVYACSDKCAEDCLLYTSPSPRDATLSRMPSSA